MEPQEPNSEKVKMGENSYQEEPEEDYQLVTKHAKLADRMYFFGKQKERYLKECEFIDTLIKNRKLGSRIIDVGCGTGVHMLLLSQRGYDVSGFDIRKEMVEVARERNPTSKIVVGDMRDFPLEDIVDTITCMYGYINYLETEEDFLKTLEKFYSHLSGRGIVIIDTRCYDNLSTDIESWVTDEYILVKRWVKDKNRVGLYRVFYSIPSEGVMVMEDHRQYFQDPFWIADKLVEVGFIGTKIFDNYDLNKKFTRQSTGYKPVVVGFKSN